MTEEARDLGRPGAFEIIAYGGVTVGILDFLDASIFFMLYAGATLQRVWQGVAAGLLGRDAAVAGGWNTAALGIILHFVIAFIIAAIYYAGTRFAPVCFVIRSSAV